MERYPESPTELDRGGVVKLVIFFGPGLFLTGWGLRGVVDFAAGLF
jgi:hypothetical protein